MGRNFVAKFRVLIISVSFLFLLVAFQNCGKNSLRLGAQSLAQSEPTTSPSPEPDPIADPPPDVAGVPRPHPVDPAATHLVVGKLDRIVTAPDCFTLAVVSENINGQVVLHAQLVSSSTRAVYASSGKLLLAGGGEVVEVPAASIDSATGDLVFNLTGSQLESGGISGAFAGAGFNVLLAQCTE